MAASANRDAQRQPGDIALIPGSSGYHIYAGTLVQKGVGTAVTKPLAVAGASTFYFAGVACDELNLTSGGSIGDLRVYTRGIFTFKAQGTASNTYIGSPAYGIDDETVGTSVADLRTLAGVIVGIDGTAKYRVLIDSAVGTAGTTI